MNFLSEKATFYFIIHSFSTTFLRRSILDYMFTSRACCVLSQSEDALSVKIERETIIDLMEAIFNKIKAER